LKKYGLTPDDYDRMVVEQGGVCAICHRPEKAKLGLLHVDHDHTNNRVRGLLCQQCNTGLGKFQDNIRILQSAINYLR
jgi:hypothetical protein